MSDTPGPEPAALLTRHGSVAVITLNRPRSMNAANGELSTLVGGFLEEINRDDAISVGVLTGTGRAFCAGMDLKAFAAGEDVSAAGHPEWGFAGAAQHWIDKPLIAAVNGPAYGGGAELVLACDLAIASTAAALAVPEVKVGLFAAGGGAIRLPRLLSRGLAAEILFTGRPLTAQEAQTAGLFNRVVEPEELLDRTLELAEQIAANAPLALRATKRVMYRSLAVGDDWSPEAWELNTQTFGEIATSADALEGATAFAEKRAPRWTGR